MTSECKQQFTLRISRANPTEMIVILYEMLLAYLEEGEAARDKAQLREAVRKTRGCLNELINSLNLEYDPAPALLQLYLYCTRRLVAWEMRGEEEAPREIRKVIQPLHDAYAQIEKLNQQGAVMNNSQTVYAGLTYGRTTLTENMADQSPNRGMLV